MRSDKISDNPGWKQTLTSQGGFIRSVFCLAFLAIFGYSVYLFGQPFYKYTTFKSEVKEILRMSPGTRPIRHRYTRLQSTYVYLLKKRYCCYQKIKRCM